MVDIMVANSCDVPVLDKVLQTNPEGRTVVVGLGVVLCQVLLLSFANLVLNVMLVLVLLHLSLVVGSSMG